MQLSSHDLNANALPLAGALLFGYLLGSIPFGLIFGWIAGAGDVREIGSGNTGATNVLRAGKTWAAAATLICDAGKGAFAVLIPRVYGLEPAVIAAIGAFLGHIFPLWLNFRGGKGVATFLGIVLALDWRVGLLVALTWLITAGIWRISSLSALIAAAAAPIYLTFSRTPLLAIPILLLALMIFATHRENIRRLAHGEEPRIGRKAAAQRT